MITAIVLFCVSILIQSEPAITEIKDTETIELIHSIKSDSRFQTSTFSLVVFKKSNPPGSAGIQGTGEISHSYYLAISEFDEYPDQSVFLIGGFYNPKFEVDIRADHCLMRVSHGPTTKRQLDSFKIELHSVSEF